MDAILVGLEKTACLIDKCTIYELLYTNRFTASRNLEESILQLYTAILKFLAKAIKMLNGGPPEAPSDVTNRFSASHLKAVFIGEISDYLDEVKQLGNAVEQRASVAEAQCIIPLYHN